MNIIIVGIAGVGKSTIGKLLANNLNMEFVDLDRSIEAICGVDVQRIFAIEGENGFRKRETSALRQVLESNFNCVLSVGGGCVIREENRDLIANNDAYVVHLTASVSALAERLSYNIDKRPLFNNEDIQERIIQLKKERDNLYNLVCDLKVDTTDMKALSVVDYISRKFNNKVQKLPQSATIKP